MPYKSFNPVPTPAALTSPRRLRRPAIIVGAFVLLALIATAFGYSLTTGVFAQRAGERMQFTYHDADITVSLDAHGIPTIESPTIVDGYAGLGYAEASQRLFQLLYLNWGAQGQLAAHLGAGPGNAYIIQDSIFATFDLPTHAAAHLAAAAPKTRQALNAFAVGVNAYLHSHVGQLPHDVTALNILTVPDWTAQDSMQVLLFVASSLDVNTYLGKIVYSAIAAQSPAAADALIPSAPDATSMFDMRGALTPPTQVLAVSGFSGQTHDTNGIALGRAGATALNALAKLPNLSSLTGGRASNNFAISGAHTKSGQALLANDPHLAFTTPSLTYLARVNAADGTRLSGMTIPGAAIWLSAEVQHASGERTGWALTYGMTDNVDVRLEQPEAVTATRIVTLDVAGGAPVTLHIGQTAHGPLLNGAFPAFDAIGKLSVQSTIADHAWTIDGFFALPAARDRENFTEALRHESIGLNFLFAIGPHIGYQYATLAPVRDPANTVGIVPGTPAYDWQGFVAYADLPHAYDPPSGFLNTSNQRIVPATYAPNGIPVYLSNAFDYAFRAQEATRDLGALVQRGEVTATDVAEVQVNVHSQAAAELSPQLVTILRHAGVPQGTEAQVAALATWDHHIHADSEAALIYELWVSLLARDLVQPLLGASYPLYAQAVFITTQLAAVEHQVRAPTLLTAAQRDHWVVTAFKEAAAIARANTLTTWGDLHRIVYMHPFVIPGTAYRDPRYAIGPAEGYARAGDPTTLNVGTWQTQLAVLALPTNQQTAAGGVRAAFTQDALASSRVVWDLGTPAHSIGVCSTGESGEPGQHYGDLAELWRAGETVQLWFSH